MPVRTTSTSTSTTQVADHSAKAYRILHLGFTVAPILFGLDKFTNLMVDWTRFLPDFVTTRVDGAVVMGLVGVIEIAAGLGVWFKPKLFAPVVAGWLVVIIFTLALAGGFWDIALRDFGLLLAALAFSQLARAHS